MWIEGSTLFTFFIFFLFLQVLGLFATLRVMTDSKCFSLHTRSSLANSPYFSPFSRFLAVVLALPPTFGLPLLSLVKHVFTCLIVFPLPL